MNPRKRQRQFALCIRNDSCEDLQLRRVYQVLQDESAQKADYVRVVDDSGEDYLYPSAYFVAVKLPKLAETCFAVGGGEET